MLYLQQVLAHRDRDGFCAVRGAEFLKYSALVFLDRVEAQTPPAMTFMAIAGFIASRQVKQTMEWNNRVEVPVCLDCRRDGAVEHQCRAD